MSAWVGSAEHYSDVPWTTAPTVLLFTLENAEVAQNGKRYPQQ